MRKQHILIFEPNTGGHHGLFVQHLVKYWCAHTIPGTLHLLVDEHFLSKHQALATLLRSKDATNISVHTFLRAPAQGGDRRSSLISHDLRSGQILLQHLKVIRPTHCLLMYFDHLQLSLGTRLRNHSSTVFSGIYFRPSFHYASFMNQHLTWKERLRELRKKVQLRLALSNPKLKTLFCLDPFVVPHINKFRSSVKAVKLADGIELIPSASDNSVITNSTWDIDGARKVALLFGSLSARKGIFEVLNALPYLERSLQQKLAIIFAGSVTKDEQPGFEAALEASRSQTGVQLIIDNRFVGDDEVPAMITQADLILVTYLRHTGSSNVLVRAAAAGKPVLGSDYGLVGAQIIKRKLGLALDTTQPKAIAKGLKQFLLQPDSIAFDAEEALNFSRENTATAFATTIFKHISEEA